VTLRWLAVMVVVALAGCGVDVPHATAIDAQRAAQLRPGTTLEELERGRSLYLAKCTSCHAPVAPRSHTPEAWPAQVAKMAERAKVTSAEVDLLVLYLTTVSVATSAPAPAPAPAPEPAPAS
jgi:hypothetical protein